MDEQLQDDWLEARLRDEAHYIDDAGFTSRVMQKLPARQPQRSFREAILLSITLLASAITYTVSDGAQFLVSAVNRLASMPLLFICLVAICCTLLMTTIAAGAAFSKARE